MSARGAISAFAVPALIVGGCLALLLRSAGTSIAALVTAGVGVLGLLTPLPSPSASRPSAVRWLATVAIGVAAFGAARAWSVAVPCPASPFAVGANMVAAVSEELFFRRLMYGWLLRWGPGIAITASAVAFALVHVRAYGVLALPLDLAAGLLLSWQRWSSGGWEAPAITHMAANLLQMR